MRNERHQMKKRQKKEEIDLLIFQRTPLLCNVNGRPMRKAACSYFTLE